MVLKKLLNKTICVVGLGYVGLPLAEDFSKHIRTIGYRRDQKKVDALNATPGNTIEATTDPRKIKEADFVIIAVPTPVTKAKDPDMEPVISASETVGQNQKKWCNRRDGIHGLSRCDGRGDGPDSRAGIRDALREGFLCRVFS